MQAIPDVQVPTHKTQWSQSGFLVFGHELSHLQVCNQSNNIEGSNDLKKY